MCPRYILSDNGNEFKNQLMNQVLQQLSIDHIFSAPYHPQSNEKLEVFHKYLKPTLKKLCKKDPPNWNKYLTQVFGSYRVTPNLAMAGTPYFLVYSRDPKPTTTPTSRTYAALPRGCRIWTTQPRSPLTHLSYCKENVG